MDQLGKWLRGICVGGRFSGLSVCVLRFADDETFELGGRRMVTFSNLRASPWTVRRPEQAEITIAADKVIGIAGASDL